MKLVSSFRFNNLDIEAITIILFINIYLVEITLALISYFTPSLPSYYKRILTVVGLLFVINGCTSLSKTALVPIQVDQISQAKAWELQGKIFIKNQGKKLSSNLYWRHNINSDELVLTTVIGTEILRLFRQPDLTTLEFDGEKYTDQQASRLLTRITGLSLPIEQLPHWITGQVQAQHVKHLDEYGRIAQAEMTFQHQAWQLNYLSWQKQSGVAIPKQMKLNKAGLQLKIQVNHWQALTQK
ncbi:MAG: lipoprotein insertase outer membrane protein LolB [Parashewanella sp.]